ncbi:hypothetical protein EV361DRAFT_895516 [Lentinula raphanica]|nr:hypothetical protein EV361DRAFT_895516 [Lentinula raphanica]
MLLPWLSLWLVTSTMRETFKILRGHSEAQPLFGSIQSNCKCTAAALTFAGKLPPVTTVSNPEQLGTCTLLATQLLRCRTSLHIS